MERTKDIVLKGKVSGEELEKYESIILQDDVRSIDIANFSINLTDDELESSIDFNETEPLLIEKLLLNRTFSKRFIVKDDLVLSEDERVLINSFNKKEMSVPSSVEVIGNYAFCCNPLKSIDIPYGVKQIGNAAFNFCEDIDELILPDSVEELGESAFAYCDFEWVKLSQKLKSIPDGCFEYCHIEDIDIPSSVRRIGSDAFHCNWIERVKLPEGVESIGWNVFTHINEYIYFPSTMKEIEKDFFYEDCIDIPEDCVPFIEVNEDNPIFFSKDGTLYTYADPETPYLGYRFEDRKDKDIKEKPLIIFPETPRKSKEYSPEEVMEKFKECQCEPMNDTMTMFRIHSFSGGYNIIDRYLHHYINPEYGIRDIQFSKNNFIMIRPSYFSADIYSMLLNSKILSQYDGYNFESCDNEGRIYVSKEIPVPKERLRIHYYKDTTSRAGCIDVHKNVIIPCEYDGYKSISHFQSDGLAIVNKGSKYGMIDTKGNIVIPIEYHYIYSYFDENGLARVHKKQKGEEMMMFINRHNEVVGKFLEPDIAVHRDTRFHLYEYNGKLGYAKQHGYDYSEAIYNDIRVIDDKTIEVSIDGTHYDTIKY